MDVTIFGSRQRNHRPANLWPALASATAIALMTIALGCRTDRPFHFSRHSIPPVDRATEIEYPDTETDTPADILNAPPPETVLSSGNVQYWPLKIEEAIQIALSNSRVMRDLGGRVLRTPSMNATVYDPALSETDPLRGPEAALSAFDASFTTSMFWLYNDLNLSTDLLGGLSSQSQQNLGLFQTQIAKTATTGTQFYVKNLTAYGKNNLLIDIDGYYTQLAAGFRQPLLQGSGIAFNRIAGPNARPGMYNGILIGRINTDVTLADFETGVRDLLFNVEQAYWELYRSYRELDARVTARDAALETWQLVERRFQSGAADREQEAHARQQYYLFDAQVINAQTGASLAGESGGATSIPGVLNSERRLRWLMGLPPTDGRVIRPADVPSDVRVQLDWGESLQDALARRVELRRQRWVIKRRELELIAARNFLQMRLDVTGQYGVSGLGVNLLGQQSPFDDLVSGDIQNWQLGLQLSTPIGNRIGHTAVRNAELQLTRERAIYRDQELRAAHDLSNALAEVDRSYAVARAAFNGFIAAHQQLEEVRKKYDAGLVPLDFLLDAQRRAVDADSTYYQATVQYSVSVTAVYLARGTLLAYNNVYLNEGPWSEEAYNSAARQSRRFGPRVLNYVFETPPQISRGQYVQEVATVSTEPTPSPAPTEQTPPHTESSQPMPLPKPPVSSDTSQTPDLDPSVVQTALTDPSPIRQPVMHDLNPLTPR